jgi:hypothetical protein
MLSAALAAEVETYIQGLQMSTTAWAAGSWSATATCMKG